MTNYNHKKVEEKWQFYWRKNKVFEVKEEKGKKKFYGLIEFPYASGDGLHTGHLRSNTAMDIIARKRRMQGYNVLYPIGYDSFGLPTENYAIKTGVNPKTVTEKNIKIFAKQLKSSGFSFDWSRVFSTTDPDYYKWTQWIFIQMFKNGLAYKAKENINWCTACKIGLAKEEVVNGVCERCGAEVVMKEKEQWLLRITKYADRLINDLEKVDYLEQIKTQQINWIGRSQGAEIKFQIPNSKFQIQVFTTRPDTLFGATFMVVAPEHGIIKNLESRISNLEEVKKYIKKAQKKSELERTDLAKEKTGVELKGIKAINPVNQEEIPIFVADYVMMTYGTGAIMAVPAHDERDWEFARKYNLEIMPVVLPHGRSIQFGTPPDKIPETEIDNIKNEAAYCGEGIAINSGKFDGLTTKEFKEKITKWLEKKGLGKQTVNYKLHDWIFSRQRYWGEPIPIIYCRKCWENPKSKTQNPKEGIDFIYINGKEHAIIPVPEKDLPVVLPDVEDFMPTNQGDSPLAKVENWVNTKCPTCGGPAKRETDVMPNWAGSNWYFIRYCDPKNKKQMVDPEKAKYWLPVDWYNGGMEHTTLHLLYSRFIYKFLYDIGAVPKELGPEPYKKRTAHGMVLGQGGIKMSKSKGNVINPDDYIEKYGADTVRLYEMFMGPFDQAIAWDDSSVIGVYRFLQRVWKLQSKVDFEKGEIKKLTCLPARLPTRQARQGNKEIKGNANNANRDLERLVHQTIKKVGQDIEDMKFNTAVSQLMILVNEMEKQENLPITNYQLLIIILSPFAPHMAEELWSKLGNKKSITYESWPEYDEKLTQEDEIELVIQVNGKVRDKIKVPADIFEDDANKLAMKSEKVSKWLEGKKPKKIIFVKGKLINIVI